MSEDEAMEKWCPFARTTELGAFDPTRNTNRDAEGRPLPGAKCIGSACMAWRDHRGYPDEGYCGLAGKP